VGLAGRGGEGGCYLGEADADVGPRRGHGACASGGVLVAGVGVRGSEAEAAFDPGQDRVPYPVRADLCVLTCWVLTQGAGTPTGFSSRLPSWRWRPRRRGCHEADRALVGSDACVRRLALCPRIWGSPAGTNPGPQAQAAGARGPGRSARDPSAPSHDQPGPPMLEPVTRRAARGPGQLARRPRILTVVLTGDKRRPSGQGPAPG
jgi:hypothetical protein